MNLQCLLGAINLSTRKAVLKLKHTVGQSQSVTYKQMVEMQLQIRIFATNVATKDIVHKLLTINAQIVENNSTIKKEENLTLFQHYSTNYERS